MPNYEIVGLIRSVDKKQQIPVRGKAMEGKGPFNTGSAIKIKGATYFIELTEYGNVSVHSITVGSSLLDETLGPDEKYRYVGYRSDGNAEFDAEVFKLNTDGVRLIDLPSVSVVKDEIEYTDRPSDYKWVRGLLKRK